MRTKILLALALCFGLGAPPAHSQASPYSISVFPAKIFTATGQTSTVIQLNGLVVPSTVGSSFASGTITLTGTSLTTATFGVWGSSDNGGNYYPIPIASVATPGTLSAPMTATANGLYQVNLAGMTHIKFVTSGTFTATNITLTLSASPNGLITPIGGGTASVTAAAMQAALATQTGCTTAGYAWNPATNTCLAAGGGSSGVPTVNGSANPVVLGTGATCGIVGGVQTCTFAPGGSFTAAGDLSGSSSTQTVTGLQGHPVSSAAPVVGGSPTWNGTNYVPTIPALAAMPSPSTLITDYDFHDGAGTTISDVSGHSNNMTLTSGTPGGTSAPTWVKNPVTGAGVGLAMGTDSAGSYGLPTALIGTSCETVPVLQNAARTVMIQYFNPPVGTDGTQTGILSYPNTFAIQDFLGSSNSSLGYDFYAYEWTMPLVSDNTGGNLVWSRDNMVGFHTDIIVFSNSGATVFYHDGQPLGAYTNDGVPSLSAVNWVLGCNGVVQAGGDQVTAPSLVFRLSFWSNALNAIEAQQAYGFVTNNLLTSKGFQPTVVPSQLGKNQYVCLGDSQCAGNNGGGGGPALVPYVACALTNACYGTTYNSALSNFGGNSWEVGAYGLPGAGTGSLPSQVLPGLAKLRGDNNGIHIADILIGTNGGGAPPCATIQNLRLAGWDVWVELLFSLSTNPVNDQSFRDPFNFNELQSSIQCGATGIIDTSADAFIGADGTNGTSPYMVGANAHLSQVGQAYKMQLNARVLNAYYMANPNVQTVYSASTVTLNGPDRYTTFNTSSIAIAAHLPDCIGMVSMPYYFTVTGGNAVTLTPAAVTGQTETINGGGSYVMSGNSVYKFFATTAATVSAAPGGCQWVVAQAPGAGGGSTFAPGGDLSGSSSSQNVIGINAVPLCTGFTPTNGQVLQYTTGGSPSPCYGAASVGAPIPGTYYNNSDSYSSGGIWAAGANTLTCGAFIVPPNGLNVGHINFIIGAPSTANADVGIYSPTGNLEAHIGAQSISGGFTVKAFVGGTQTIAAGLNYACVTEGSGSPTLQLYGTTGSYGYDGVATGNVSSGGVLPSTMTPYSPSLGGGSIPIFSLIP